VAKLSAKISLWLFVTNGRKKKGHNRWKKSKTTTRRNYLKNITLKFNFSEVVLGSDIKAILYAFKRDLPLFIEKDHFTLEEELFGKDEINSTIPIEDFDKFKSSLLFVMSLNGKVFAYDSIVLKEKVINLSYDKFFINSCYYSKLKDPFNPEDELIAIDKLTIKIPYRKKSLVEGLSFNRDKTLIAKIEYYKKHLYCYSILKQSELNNEENKIFSVKFESQEILSEMGITWPIESIDRNIDQHRKMKIDYENYHNITNLTIEEILDVGDSNNSNMILYEKLGQTVF
jgi:hypothetical protein